MATAPYKLAHARVKSRWASASNYHCLICELDADDWALDNDAPDIETDEQGRRYSLNPRNYFSACRRCHKLYDAYYRRHGSTEGWADIAWQIWLDSEEQRESGFWCRVASLYAVSRAGYPKMPRNGDTI